jgi:hypothetical protein
MKRDEPAERINLDSAKLKFWQDADSDSKQEVQEMEIEFKDAGGGVYPVIKTEEWAVNDLSQLISFFNKLKEFEKALLNAN